MTKEKPQAEEGKLPIDKFLDEHPGFAKDAVPRVVEEGVSENMSLEKLVKYIDKTHRSGDGK